MKSNLLFEVSGQVDEYGYKITHYRKYKEEDPQLQEFVENEWRFQNPDFEIYEKANATLDAHIVSIENFEDQLNIFQDMLNSAQEKCEQYNFEDCYFSDQGCGRKCLDMQILDYVS